MGYEKISQILEDCDASNKEFWRVILEDDCKEQNISESQSFEKMQYLLNVMKDADVHYDGLLNSASGLAGGDGAKFGQYKLEAKSLDKPLIGDYLSMVIEKAIKMGESNACMKRIVAMPTAGSCGVIPAVLLSYLEYKNVPEQRIVESLYVAGGIGEVIAASASISGAEGGCQAEIGTASAMAAGALTYLEGGTNEMIVNATTLALKNLLGLTCDPVAGLVEVPCIKRNASGAVNAVTSSQIALAGIKSAIPPDETIDSMRRIGKQMPPCLKETGLEGLAITPTAKLVAEKL